MYGPPMTEDDFIDQMQDIAETLQNQNQNQYQQQQQDDRDIIERLNRVKFIFTVDD